MAYCPSCAAKLIGHVGEPMVCPHPGPAWPASPVVAVDEPPAWTAERAADEQAAAERAADGPARPKRSTPKHRAPEAAPGYSVPPELEELGELFTEAHERVARALAIEADLADPLAGMYAIGDALRDLTAGLREWHATCASPMQRRVSAEAAAELRALVQLGATPAESKPS